MTAESAHPIHSFSPSLQEHEVNPAKINEKLYIAAAVGAFGVCVDLLQQGADPNSAIPWMDIIHTPLHAAAFKGHTDICRLLLAHGADVHAADSGGHTPLHSAASQGHDDICQILLAAGADPDARTQEGETAAMLATTRLVPRA